MDSVVADHYLGQTMNTYAIICSVIVLLFLYFLGKFIDRARTDDRVKIPHHVPLNDPTLPLRTRRVQLGGLCHQGRRRAVPAPNGMG